MTTPIHGDDLRACPELSAPGCPLETPGTTCVADCPEHCRKFAETTKAVLAALNKIGTGEIERTELRTEGPRSYAVVASKRNAPTEAEAKRRSRSLNPETTISREQLPVTGDCSEHCRREGPK